MAEKKKLTPEQRKKVEDQIKALQDSLKEQEAAEGAAASAEAAEDVEEQKEKLAALFDRLNLTEEDYDLLVSSLASGTEERTRQIVREELAAEEESSTERGSLKDAAENPKGAKPNADEDKPPDTPAPSKHWTERKLFGKKDEPEVPDAA